MSKIAAQNLKELRNFIEYLLIKEKEERINGEYIYAVHYDSLKGFGFGTYLLTDLIDEYNQMFKYKIKYFDVVRPENFHDQSSDSIYLKLSSKHSLKKAIIIISEYIEFHLSPITSEGKIKVYFDSVKGISMTSKFEEHKGSTYKISGGRLILFQKILQKNVITKKALLGHQNYANLSKEISKINERFKELDGVTANLISHGPLGYYINKKISILNVSDE